MAVSGPRDGVMVERVVHWTLNGAPRAPFLCTPADLEDLVIGHLLSAGLIQSADSIADIRVADGRIAVEAEVQPAPLPFVDERLAALLPSESPLRLPLSALQAACRRLTGEETWWGTHRLMLLGPDGELAREDIGRHNAADKVIGAAARLRWPLQLCALGATGRLSLEIVAKAAAMHIPVLFSKKYASDLSRSHADRLNMAIAGSILSASPDLSGALWRLE